VVPTVITALHSLKAVQLYRCPHRRKESHDKQVIQSDSAGNFNKLPGHTCHRQCTTKAERKRYNRFGLVNDIRVCNCCLSLSK
jgi:hypothetical protein